MPTFDSVNLTELSESSPRTMNVDTLQIHHATTTSLAGLRDLMSAGGRQVSANAAMGNDGHLMSVVDISRRAFTSATPYDHRSYTVEVCNTTLGPEWGISAESHERLALLAAQLHQEIGLPLDRAHIIGHREVPGTYATACPGPSMNLDWITTRAQQLVAGANTKDEEMSLMIVSGKTYYTLVTASDWIDLPNPMPAALQSAALKTYGNAVLWTAAEETALKAWLPKRGTSIGGGITIPADLARKGDIPTVAQIATGVNDEAANRLKS